MTATRPTYDADSAMFGNRFLTREVPTSEFPQDGMSALDAMRLVGEDLALEGDPARNLATFVTTWMEPEAQRIIADNLHRNFIDHAEYPRTAEIEQRCIRMLADLFHAPGRDDRSAHAGVVRGDHARQPVAEVELAEASGGGRQVDGEPEPGLRRRRARGLGEVLPLLRRRAADRAAAAGQVHDRAGRRRAAHRREHDRRRRRARHDLHRAPGRHRRASTTCWCGSRTSGDSTCRCTSTARAAGSSGRSSIPTRSGTSGWSRCARSTSPGTSSGWSTPASAG